MTELEERVGELARAEEQSRSLAAELDEAREHLASLGASHKAVQLELGRLRKSQRELEAGLRSRDRRLQELHGLYRDRGIQLKSLEADVRRLSLGRRMAMRSPAPAYDDLKRIPGVGPVLEKKLHAEGIHFYLQLADLEPDEATILAEGLGIKPDRIEREDWTGAARLLHEGKYARTS